MGELRRIKSDTPMTSPSTIPMTPTMSAQGALSMTLKDENTMGAITVSMNKEQSVSLPSSDDDIYNQQHNAIDVDSDLYISDNDGCVTSPTSNEGHGQKRCYDGIDDDDDDNEYNAMYVKSSKIKTKG